MPTNSHILAVYFGLLIIAALYNKFVVEEMEKRGVEGYTWAQVAGGVAFTLVGAAFLVGWQAALLTLGAFAASGLPMIAGAIVRHEQRVQRTVQRARANEQQTKTPRQ